MKIVKKVRCSGIWDEGPFKGQQCTETNPRNLVHCESVLDPGCDGYFCLWAHWPKHWQVHE